MITLMDKYTIIKLKETGLSNRQIAKQLGIDRKTVNKYWNDYINGINQLVTTESCPREVQERIVSKPTYNTANRKTKKYSYAIDQALDRILASEKEKLRVLGSNKQKLTNLQIHQELTTLGFDIGKTTISMKIAEKRKIAKECFIRQEYDYGDRLEFDFGEVKLVVDNELVKYYMAVLSSPASNLRWCYLYKNQTKDVFLDAHVKFFEMMQGVYREVVYDNMKNVVSRFIGKNEKVLNEDLVKMSLYYGFNINVTNCFSGNEKGHVEGSVKFLRNKIFGPKYQFSSFEHAVDYMNHSLQNLYNESNAESEKPALLPYKPRLELAQIRTVTVDKYSFARIENNFYSVPDYLVGKTITTKIYHEDIYFYANDYYLCTHKKIDGSKETRIDIRHYLGTFEKKPGALNNSLALKSMPELKSIYDNHFKSNPKKFIELLKDYQEMSVDELTAAITRKVQGQLMEPASHSTLATMTMNQLKLYNDLSFREVLQ